MVRQRKIDRQLQELARRFTPQIREAFLAAVADIVERATIARIIEAIELGDINAAFRATGLSPAAMRPVTAMIEQAFETGGVTVANVIAQNSQASNAATFRFDVRNSRAEAWARDHSSSLVTRITSEMETNIRSAINRGILDGRNPRNIALDIVGRINPDTGRRTGGIVGLTGPQETWVANARRQLTDLDPAYFNRKARDARFDSVVRRAIAEGKPLSASKIDAIVARYSDRLLLQRGETIARTESVQSLNKAADEAFRQAIDEGTIAPTAVKKRWDSAGPDGRTRPDHLEMDGQTVQMDEPFVAPDGSRLMFPGDISMGASAEQIINCFAPWSRVSVGSLHRAIRSHYIGQLIEISFGIGNNTTITVNHPILTNRGWVGAGEIVEGDQLIYSGIADQFGLFNPQKNNTETTAQQLYSSCKMAGLLERVNGKIVNFHGHVPTKDIDIVTLPSELWDTFHSPLFEFFHRFSLPETDIKTGTLLFNRIIHSADFVGTCVFSCRNSFFGTLLSLFRRKFSGRKPVAFRNRRTLQTNFVNNGVNKCSRNPENFGGTVDSVTGRNEISNWLMKLLTTFKVPFTRCFPSGVVREQFKIVQNGSDNLGTDSDGNGDSIFTQPTRMQRFNLIGELRTIPGMFFSVPFALAAHNTGLTDNAVNEIVGDAQFVGNTPDGQSGSISGKDGSTIKVGSCTVSKVRAFHYEGPVYNFETSNGLVLSNGIVSHNCRCRTEYDVDWFDEID